MPRRPVTVATGALVSLALMTGIAMAGTTIDSGDVAVIDAASASPAVLARGASAAFQLSITADDGNIPDNAQQCDDVKNAATTKNDYTIGSSGLTLGGVSESVIFPCQNFSGSGGSPSTQTFHLDVIASDAVGAKAPLGASDYPISFGSSGTNVVLGSQLTLDASFTSPRIYVVVNPRPAAGLAATPGNAQITLDWSASPDASDITDYKVEVTGGKSAVLTAAKGAVQLVDSGLTNGTEYCYRIRARYEQAGTDYFSAWEPASTTVCATPVAPASSYAFNGFYSPVENESTAIYNVAKAGQGVPFKFELFDGTTEITSDPGIVLSSAKIPCSLNGTGDNVPDNATAGSSGLHYDNDAGHFVFVWKTLKDWANTCRRFTVSYGGESLTAVFKFTR